LKQDPATASIKVVMLSAKAQTTDISEAETVGADDYCTKPFSPVALLEKVRAMIGAWA